MKNELQRNCWQRCWTPASRKRRMGPPRRRCIGRRDKPRTGKILVFLAVSLPALLGIVGLVFDTGLIMSDKENLQHATDAAATAAAMDLLENKTSATAVATAATYLQILNGFADAQITTNIPPSSGPFAGKIGFVEVIATRQHSTAIMQVVGEAFAVADYRAGSRGLPANDCWGGGRRSRSQSASAASEFDVANTTVIPFPDRRPATPRRGAVQVNGAVLVNTAWGGVDQNGQPVGTGAGPPRGIACTYDLPLTQLKATNIRVVGGVDTQNNYANYVQGNASPLRRMRCQLRIRTTSSRFPALLRIRPTLAPPIMVELKSCSFL